MIAKIIARYMIFGDRLAKVVSADVNVMMAVSSVRPCFVCGSNVGDDLLEKLKVRVSV